MWERPACLSRFFAGSLGLGLVVAQAAAGAQSDGGCQPSWVPTFGGAPGVDSDVVASTVFDDGGGPALYVGGFFTTAGGVAANYVAKWNGSSWSALGSGMNGSVYALTV